MIDPRKVRPFDGRGLPSTEDSVLAHRLVDPPPPRPSPWGAILGGLSWSSSSLPWPPPFGTATASSCSWASSC